MPQLRRVLALAFVICSLTAAARAQPVAAASEALFRAGREALQRGDTKTALEKFQESYRLDPALGTLLNLGVCEEALGELSNAWQRYQQVIHALPADDDRVAIANQHLQQLDPRLPRLTVHRAAGSPDDTHASLSGVALGAASFDVALPLDPGSYVVEAMATGRAAQSYSVELHEGDRLELEIAPGALLPEAAEVVTPVTPSQPSTTSDQPAAQQGTGLPISPVDAAAEPSAATAASTRRVVADTLLGAGAASLIAAAVSGGLMLDRRAIVDRNCPNHACNARGLAATESFNTLWVFGLSALGVGVAATGTALFLLLTEPQAHKPKVVIQPLLSLTTLGLSLHASL